MLHAGIGSDTRCCVVAPSAAGPSRATVRGLLRVWGPGARPDGLKREDFVLETDAHPMRRRSIKDRPFHNVNGRYERGSADGLPSRGHRKRRPCVSSSGAFRRTARQERRLRHTVNPAPAAPSRTTSAPAPSTAAPVVVSLPEPTPSAVFCAVFCVVFCVVFCALTSAL